MHIILETFLNPIFPIFSIMFVGIVLARFSLFDVSAAEAINRFVFYAAMPALIFNLVCEADFSIIDWKIPLLYFLSELTVFIFGTLLSRCFFKRSLAESLLLGMTACFVNHAFFILPIAAIIYGEKAVALITVIIVIDTSVIFGGMITGLEIAHYRHSSVLNIVKHLLCNPVLVAITLGLLVNLLGIPLHEGIHTYASFVGKAAAPASLFCLGIILASSCAKKPDHAALCITFLKIVVFPAVVWICVSHLNGFQPVLRDTLMLTAAGPCGAMPFVLAMQYRVNPESIGLAILYSTFISLLTLPIVA
ncbi:AEC family transporter [Desulforhopalus sp. IMCC35007]|uniref:AEC family transporter n=1 Tax=Desulforhopalus sp. IMCC35007 TaxID=2569543 RepID=UPI0010AE9089|nr:AEC family transporter [Desulforhopalus sp. IMCC35007]TKB12326.1 AEC family transporter [Desulforhopalus sp. IMCC35007]